MDEALKYTDYIFKESYSMYNSSGTQNQFWLGKVQQV